MNEVDLKKRAHYIWKFARPYSGSFVNAFFCILMTSVISMIYPYVFGLMVDEVFYNKNLKFFILIIAGYAIIYFSEQLLHLILNILWPYQYTVFLLEVRKAVYKKILSLKYSQLSDIPVGDMVGKINWESEAFVELIHRNLEYLLSSTIKLMAVIAFMFVLNFKLAMLMIIVVPASYVISYKLGKQVGDKQRYVRDSYMGFLGWIFEMLGGIRDIKLLGAQKQIAGRFERRIQDLNKKNVEVAKKEVLSDRVCALIALITNLSLYALAGILIYNGEITLGTFIAAISYFEMANDMLAKINKFWGKIHSNHIIIDKVIGLLESDTEETDAKKPEISIQKGVVEFKNVNFSYQGESKVLCGFQLNLNPGDRIALVGRSGSGKSTVVNLLLRLLEPESGTICIDRQEISQYSISSLRRQVGIVQQDAIIFEGSIRSNLLLAKEDATDAQLLEALEQAALGSYMRQLEKGLDTVIGRNGISMSGGERQRLAIARLFLKNPKVLIFDEATSALDYEAEALVNEAWSQLGKGKTSIMIAHRLSTVLTADKVAVLSEGKITAYGNHMELFAHSPEYKELFEEQYLSREKILMERGAAI